MAEANNENTVIRAPFTRTVLRKDAEVGEGVAPSVGGGLMRGAVVTMADLTTLEVEVDVNEAYISRIVNGRPARISLDAYPDRSFRGLVRPMVPTADGRTRLIAAAVCAPLFFFLGSLAYRVIMPFAAYSTHWLNAKEVVAATNGPAEFFIGTALATYYRSQRSLFMSAVSAHRRKFFELT